MAAARLQVSQKTLAEQYSSGFLIRTEKKRLQSIELVTRDHLPDGGAGGVARGLVETTEDPFSDGSGVFGIVQHSNPVP